MKKKNKFVDDILPAWVVMWILIGVCMLTLLNAAAIAHFVVTYWAELWVAGFGILLDLKILLS